EEARVLRDPADPPQGRRWGDPPGRVEDRPALEDHAPRRPVPRAGDDLEDGRLACPRWAEDRGGARIPLRLELERKAPRAVMQLELVVTAARDHRPSRLFMRRPRPFPPDTARRGR